MVESMTEEDVTKFTTALCVTTAIGMSVIGAVFFCLDRRLKANATVREPLHVPPMGPRQPHTTAVRAGAPGDKKKGAPRAAANDVAPAPAPAAAAAESSEIKPPTITYVPMAASSMMIERAKRLMGEMNHREALVCYLSLLYSAQDGEHGSLPAHLTDCLRGAALCFRALGDAEQAAKFLQAERRVYEEMVSSMLSGGSAKKGKEGGSNLLASLLDPSAADTPHRCNVLRDVAEMCSRNGLEDIALAYRVKVAALRQKATGRPMDADSHEFHDLARSLSKLASYDRTGGGGGGDAPPPATATAAAAGGSAL